MVDLSAVSANCNLAYEKKRMMAYGNYHGYPVIIQLQQRDALCRFSLNVKTDDAQAAALTSFLSGLAEKNKFVKYATYKSPVISVGVVSKGGIASRKKGNDQFMQAFDEVINYCSMNQLAPCCAVCGGQENLGIYSAMGGYGIMCPACFEKAKGELANAQQELHEKPTNYAAGLVGALIGALPGVALWIIIGELGRIAAISGLVMMLGSIFGFKKLGGGKLNIGGIVISVVVAAGMLFLAEYSSLALDVYNAYKADYDISFFDAFRVVPKFLKDGDVFHGFVYDLVIGYVMLIAAAATSVYHAFKQANLKYEMQKLN